MISARQLPGLLLFVIVVLGGAWSFANLELSEARTFVYQGRLELNGAPVEIPQDFRFALSGSSASLPCLVETMLPSNCGVWQESQNDVSVEIGAFSAVIGSVQALYEVDLEEPHLFLSVAVAEAGGRGAFYLLGTPQEIHPVPRAAIVAEMTDYQVRDLVVTNALSAQTLSISSTASVNELMLSEVNSLARIHTKAEQGFTLFVDEDNVADDENWAFRVVTNSNLVEDAKTVLELNQNGTLSAARADLELLDATDFVGDNSNNNYMRFGTLQIAWGTLTRTASTGDFVVNFPANFLSSPVVNITLSDAAYGGNVINSGVGIIGTTASSFSARFKSSHISPVQRFQWMAIGRWR